MLSEKPWRTEQVLLLCAALLTCWLLGGLTIGLLHQAQVRGFQQMENVGSVLVATLCLHGFVWCFIPIFLRQHHVGWRDAFGIRGPALKRALALALLTALVILPVASLLQFLSASVLTRPDAKPEVQLAIEIMEKASSPWLRAYLGLFAVVIAPVAEEFIFRGVLYPFVKRLGFPRLAWIGVSGLFALIHFHAISFVPLFVLALMLTWLYERTDNLLAPITAHALFNGANLALLIFSTTSQSPLPR